jgi:metal-responsive CopG/Arc/MetJ family transcriptional regulator
VVRNPARPGLPVGVVDRNHMVYHMVMRRKEVLVQLDDDLVDRLDRLADKQGTSRSELLRRGAAAVLEAAEHAEADRDLQEAYRRLPQDPAIVSAASRLASLTAPEW